MIWSVVFCEKINSVLILTLLFREIKKKEKMQTAVTSCRTVAWPTLYISE
jgi:hypothetical protein